MWWNSQAVADRALEEAAYRQQAGHYTARRQNRAAPRLQDKALILVAQGVPNAYARNVAGLRPVQGRVERGARGLMR